MTIATSLEQRAAPIASVAAVFTGCARPPQLLRGTSSTVAMSSSVVCSPPHSPIRPEASLCTARERAGQLPHVVAAISAFLWGIPEACAHGHLAMLPRIASHEPIDMNEHYRAHVFEQGLTHAARRGDLSIVMWLCDMYCPRGIVWKGVEAAAVAGQLAVLQWLMARDNCECLWGEATIRAMMLGGHLDMLEWLFDQLGARVVYPVMVFEAAVEQDNLAVVKRVLGRFPHLKYDSGWVVGLATRTGDIARVQRLADLDLIGDIRSNDYIYPAVASGSLAMLEWMCAYISSCYPNIKDTTRLLLSIGSMYLSHAASQGCLDIVKWLHAHSMRDTLQLATVSAAENGHLDVLEWFHESRVGTFDPKTMDAAATNGHFEVVQWLHANRTEGCTTRAMDDATSNGHLEVVHWLHANRSEGCTTRAMDRAAANGHLNIIQWLHVNRTEGCTTEAMDGAAANGHLNIVKWLHVNRSEGCTTRAMDGAAANGHLNIIKWLHVNRTEGCTSDAMDRAAKANHFELVLWLHANRIEGCTHKAMRYAAEEHHIAMLQWLIDVYPDLVALQQPHYAGSKATTVRKAMTHIERFHAAQAVRLDGSSE